MLKEVEDQVMRDKRNKSTDLQNNGKVIVCGTCKTKMTTTNVIHYELQKKVQQNMNGSLPLQYPITRERSDIYSMRTPYDFFKQTQKKNQLQKYTTSFNFNNMHLNTT